MCSDDLNDCLECALCVACCYACCLCCCKDNKNNATVGNYPGSPAIISQPHYGTTGPGDYPRQLDSQFGPYNIPYGQQQQKDGYFPSTGGMNPFPQGGQFPPSGGQYPPQTMGQYPPGPYPPPGGPPPPYSYHQGPPPPGSYFPPQNDYYPPNAPYPNPTGAPGQNFPEQHGKF